MTLIGILAVLTMASSALYLFSSMVTLDATAQEQNWCEYHATRRRMNVAAYIFVAAFVVLICLVLAASYL